MLSTAQAVSVFTWTDNAGSNNWIASGNWSQTNGSGDYPGEKQNTDEVYLNGGFSNNTGKFDIDMTTQSSANKFTITDLDVKTDSSSDQWKLQIGAQASATLVIRESMGFLLQSGGSFVCDANIELGGSSVIAGAQGTTAAIINGKLIGGSNKVLNANGTANVGGTNLSGGTIKFTATNNDGFTGTIKVGRSKVEVTNANSLRFATVESASTNFSNRFIFPNNTLLKAFTGVGDQSLPNTLKVGNGNSGNFSYTGDFSGSGDLYMIGSGVWTLGGSGSHTGTTYINSGQIKLTNGLALKNSRIWLGVNNGLNMNGQNTTIGGLAGSGNLALGSKQLTIGGSGDYLHLGVISGTGTVKLNMNGSQDFGQNNTYSGGTLLFDGTLKCQTAGDLGATSGDLFFGNATFRTTGSHTQSRDLKFAFQTTSATIEVDSGKTLTWSGLINDPSDTQTIRKTGAGTLAVTNDSNSYIANILIEDGSVAPSASALADARIVIDTDGGLQISGADKTVGSISGSGSLTLAANLTIGNHPQSASYSGAFSQVGTKTLTKIGSGTQVLSGTSTRNGSTIIDAGKLTLNNLTETPLGTGFVTVNSTGTLSGNGIVGSSVNVNTGGTITTNSNTATLTVQSLTLKGTFACEVTDASASKVISNFALTLTDGTLDLSFPSGAPTQSAYVLMSYGSTITGKFATVQNLPTGYNIDYAYNGNQVALVVDTTAPIVSITTAQSSPTNADSISYTITFDEPVTGLVDSSDLYITGATAANTDIAATTVVNSGDDQTFTITLNNISGNGFLQFRLKANQIADAAGNPLAADPFSPGRTIDNTAPVITLNGAAAITQTEGGSWTDPGSSATDNIDASVTVNLGGDTVQPSTPGSYTITYDASDAAGNAADQKIRTVTVISNYDNWASDRGLTLGVNDAFSDNPDGDELNNLGEFALDGNPLNSASDGKIIGKIAPVSTVDYFTLTLPVRAGAVFSGATSQTATLDGVVYTIEASTDLSSFSGAVVEVSPALTSGMFALSSGWEYRTFRYTLSIATTSKAFLRVKITPAP